MTKMSLTELCRANPACMHMHIVCPERGVRHALNKRTRFRNHGNHMISFSDFIFDFVMISRRTLAGVDVGPHA